MKKAFIKIGLSIVKLLKTIWTFLKRVPGIVWRFIKRIPGYLLAGLKWVVYKLPVLAYRGFLWLMLSIGKLILYILMVFIYIPIRFMIRVIGYIFLFVPKTIYKIFLWISLFWNSMIDLFDRMSHSNDYDGRSELGRSIDAYLHLRTDGNSLSKIVAFPIFIVYLPLRLLFYILGFILKYLFIAIKGFFMIFRFREGSGCPVKLAKFGNNYHKFFSYLTASHRYKGKNKIAKHLDKTLMGRRTMPIYIELLTFMLLVLFFLPFALVILNATKTANEIIANPIAFAADSHTFFNNLTRILTSTTVKYWDSFLNSLIITSASLITIGIFSGMAAWVLVRTKKSYSRIIFILFLSGMVIPFQVVMLPLVRLMEVITTNTGLAMKDTYHGAILVYIGFGAPLSVFMLHGFIKSIPMDIEEAAIIDGCSKSQLFFKIILPILKPIFVTLLVLNGLWIWNDYLLPSLVIGVTGDVRTLPLAVANLAGAYVRQWDLLLTSVLLAAVPVVILFLFAQKHIIRGMTSGAIK